MASVSLSLAGFVAALNGAGQADLFFRGEQLRAARPAHPDLQAFVVAGAVAVGGKQAADGITGTVDVRAGFQVGRGGGIAVGVESGFGLAQAAVVEVQQVIVGFLLEAVFGIVFGQFGKGPGVEARVGRSVLGTVKD